MNKLEEAFREEFEIWNTEDVRRNIKLESIAKEENKKLHGRKCIFCGSKLMANGKCSNLMCDSSYTKEQCIHEITKSGYMRQLREWYNGLPEFITQVRSKGGFEEFLDEAAERFCERKSRTGNTDVTFEEYLKTCLKTKGMLENLWRFEQHAGVAAETYLSRAIDLEASVNRGVNPENGNIIEPTLECSIRKLSSKANEILSVFAKYLKEDFTKYGTICCSAASRLKSNWVEDFYESLSFSGEPVDLSSCKLGQILVIDCMDYWMKNCAVSMSSLNSDIGNYEKEIIESLKTTVKAFNRMVARGLRMKPKEFKNFADTYCVFVPNVYQFIKFANGKEGESSTGEQRPFEKFIDMGLYFKDLWKCLPVNTKQDMKENLEYMKKLAKEAYGEEDDEYQIWCALELNEDTGDLGISLMCKGTTCSEQDDSEILKLVSMPRT